MVRKNLHYVPKSYLSNWCDPKGKICVSDLKKNTDHNNNEPSSIFRSKHLYPAKIEDLFGKLEGDGMPIIRKIIQGEVITWDEKTSLSLYIGAQRARTLFAEKFTEDLIVNMGIKEVLKLGRDKKTLDSYMNHLRDKGWPEDSECFKNPELYMESVIKSIEDKQIIIGLEDPNGVWNSQMGNMIDSLAKKYIRADWRIHRCGEGSDFITSDAPVVSFAFGHQMKNQQLAEKKDVTILIHTFPLGPKTMLHMNLNNGGGYDDSGKMENKSFVRDMNKGTARFAYRYLVGRNMDLLTSLRRGVYKTWMSTQEEGQITPDTVNKLVILR